MDKMKELVDGLLSTESLPVPFLQRINEALLKEYRLSAGGFLTVLPKEVENLLCKQRRCRPVRGHEHALHAGSQDQ